MNLLGYAVCQGYLWRPPEDGMRLINRSAGCLHITYRGWLPPQIDLSSYCTLDSRNHLEEGGLTSTRDIEDLARTDLALRRQLVRPNHVGDMREVSGLTTVTKDCKFRTGLA